MNSFEALNTKNINGHTEKKGNLTYLSWAWAWAEVKKLYPNATYEIKKFNGGFPYLYDEKAGYIVFTSVTIDELTYEMWLPVMDSNNKTMMDKPYTIQTKYKEITVAAATMFDINKTIMRCLVKNLAMFGLGLYIYAGEDLPEGEDDNKTFESNEPFPEVNSKIGKEQIDRLTALTSQLKDGGASFIEWLIKTYNTDDITMLTREQYMKALTLVGQKLDKEKAE